MNGKDKKIGAGKKRAPPPTNKTSPKSYTDSKSVGGRNQYQNLKSKKVSFDAEGNEQFAQTTQKIQGPKIVNQLNRDSNEEANAVTFDQAKLKVKLEPKIQMQDYEDNAKPKMVPPIRGLNSNQVMPNNNKSITYGDGNTLYSQRINPNESMSSTRPLWKDFYDDQQVYRIEKHFSLTDPRLEHVREIKRWRDNDIKGNHEMQYYKETFNQNAKIMTIEKQTRLEKNANRTDGHKCLNLRKRIMNYQIHVSNAAIRVTSDKIFEGFIIMIIGLNCITLAGSDATKEETPAQKNIDLLFNIIYTTEMFLRIFSLGFILNKGSYLRDMWCQLDFVCVCTALLEYVGGGGTSLGGLRAFRVLRPLRFVNNIEGLKNIVKSIIGAIPLLRDTLIVLMFFFLIFAIGGLNLFMGLLKMRCVDELTGNPQIDDEGEEILCGYDDCTPGFYCGKQTLNPNYDVTNFDNIFWSLLNVFQCITLEGWSEIMVMYQKTYTPWTFFFFVPMVFIGAFFLLNLTLAVIQSQFAEQKAKMKLEKEREKREQEELILAAQKSTTQDDAGQAGDDEDNGPNLNLGTPEFFVAKRAAKKLIEFAKAYKTQQDNLKDIKDRAEEEAKAQAIKASNAERARIQKIQNKQINMAKALKKSKHDNLDNVSHTGKSQGGSSHKSDDGDQFVVEGEKEKGDITLELEEKVLNEILESNLEGVNKTITEEDHVSEDLEADVEQFFKQVNNNNTPPQNQGSKTVRNAGAFAPVNAFNDVGIAGGGNNRTKILNTTFEGKAALNQTTNDANKEKMNHGQSIKSQDSFHRKILEDLDFDKVVAQRFPNDAIMGALQAKKDEGNPSDNDFLDIDHPLDLSFDKDQNNGRIRVGYASDNEKPQISAQDIEDSMQSSIISSDLSIAAKIQGLQNSVQNVNNGSPDLSPAPRTATKRSQKLHANDVNMRLQRMRTFNDSGNKKKDATNDSQSTYLGFGETFNKQVSILSNLMGETNSMKKKYPNDRDNTLTFPGKQGDLTNREGKNTIQSQPERTPTSMLANKFIKNKREKLQIYQQIHDANIFDIKQPKNPAEFIDNKTHKEMINPGIPYVSTSQNAVFERRIITNQKEYLNKINKFIAAPVDDDVVSRYQGLQEEAYITTGYDPYQLKTIYNHLEVNEVEWDSDDEDALILQQQPFETVQQTGFKHYLNHLATKFIARRSDIIVSSTLSITLTPIDDGFVPCKFAKVNAKEISEYVCLRSEYRAFQVNSNEIPKRIKSHNIVESESSIQQQGSLEADIDASQDDSDLDEFDHNQSVSSRNLITMRKDSLPKLKLPVTLLSAPLDARKILRLEEKHKRLYDQQKNKYEQAVNTMKKQAANHDQDGGGHPRDQKFLLEEAQKLVDGLYHPDEDEEAEIMPINLDADKQQNLNRAMRQGGPNEQQHEMKLGDFDKLKDKFAAMQDAPQADQRMQGDHVPQKFKEDFNLPKDMSNYDIDFSEVRKVDACAKKRRPTWSGQEVLSLSLDIAKSKKILKMMSKTRVWPKGLFNYVKKFRAFLKAFIRLTLFENFLTGCVLINTVVMAMDAYDIKDQTKADLEFLNEIFTYIFIVEMTVKLLARGVKKYAQEPMNLLDGGVVILSIVEIIMTLISGGSGGAGSLQAFRTVRVFRTFRVLRVTRVLRALRSMATVIGVIQRTFSDFVMITILMFVFIFIYTLLGRQIFQGQYVVEPGEDLPRANYESFEVAFITVFQVLTMENWQQVLYVSMRAAKGSMIFKAVCAIYYISWIFIGNFILLNLFLAVLIDGFAEEDAALEDNEDDEEASAKIAAVKAKALNEEKEKRMKKLGTSKAHLQRMKTQVQVGTSMVKAKKKKAKQPRANFTGKAQLREQDLDDIEEMDSEEIRKLLVKNGVLKPKKEDKLDEKKIGEDIHADNSIYLFHRDSCFRKNVYFIQKHSRFENFIMLLIALSSVKLALESYLINEPEDSQLVIISEELDFIFNYMFITEMVLKIIALGFAMDEGSYLTDSWNRLDYFIVMTSIIDMMLTSTDIPALKVLRMLRMIRPLRVISHNPELKMIVAALFESVGSIVNVSVIVMIIWLMFAIYGMNTFMGMFFYCTEEPYRLNTQWICEDRGGEWKRFDSNFDDIGESMMTLFIVASLEGWPDILYQAIDTTKIDNGPKYESNTGQSGFFIIFILIGSFFFLNFFTGTLFMNYEKARARDQKGFTKAQLTWQELQRLIIEAKPPHADQYRPQHGSMRFTFWKIVGSDRFDVIIMSCIVLNMLQMALDHEGASQQMMALLKISNYFFTAVFFIETCVKMYVFRMNYFKTSWNKFDFFGVASSLIDLGLEMALPTPEGGQDEGGNAILSVGPQLARVLRVLRVSRVLRLAGKAENLQILLKTIVMSVESLLNVFILLMLIFFIMAVLGNTLFFSVKSGDVISEYKNFRNFHQSFSLLFSISTGEDWNRIMYDCSRLEPDCISGETCGSPMASIFFLTFNMLVGNIMLSLFILVIIMQFQKYYLDKVNPLSIFDDDFNNFSKAWAVSGTDRYAALKMKTKHLNIFFEKLPTEMRRKIGFAEGTKAEDADRIILKMGINLDDGFVYFNEMLYRVMRAQYVTACGMKLNRVLAVDEIKTQYRLAEITLHHKEQKSKFKNEDMEKVFFDTLSAKPVNLFLTRMYYRTSFHAWRKYFLQAMSKKKWQKNQDQQRDQCQRLGKAFTEMPWPEPKAEFTWIEIEVIIELQIDCEDDEQGGSEDGKSRKSGNHTLKQFSLDGTEKDSPDIFRQRARTRMISNSKRFSNLDDVYSQSQNRGFQTESDKKYKHKSMLIAHTPEEEEANADLKFVDPNSLAYQNAVLEDKINKHEKVKVNAGMQDDLTNLFGVSLKQMDEYEGQYSPAKSQRSQIKKTKSTRSNMLINAPERGVYDVSDKKR